MYYALVVLAFIAAVNGIRTFNHQFVQDEVAYLFSFKNSGTLNNGLWFDTDKRVETIGDAVVSQIGHYKFYNGRSLVHFAEQVFSGTMPFWVFCVINSLMFALFVCLLIKLVGPKKPNAVPLCLLLTICALLYVFPENYRLWTSINHSSNYLWPATLMCLVLLALKHIHSGKTLSLPAKIGIATLSFICGWSNEAVSLPLSGALVAVLTYDILRHKSIRQRQDFIVIIPEWLGTIVLLLSPGNWHRLSQTTGVSTPVDILKNFLYFITEVRFLWILAVILFIWTIVNRSAVKRFIVENFFYFNITAFSLLLVVIAHTSPRSMMAGEVSCLILTIKIVVGTLSKKVPQKVLFATAVVLALPLIAHQTMLAHDTIQYHKMEKRLIAEYEQSTDGVVLFDEIDLNPLTKPFIRRIDETKGTGGGYGAMLTLQLWTGRKDVYFNLLRNGDYSAVADPDNFYTASNRTSFTAPAYYGGGRYYWIHPDSMASGKVEVHMRPDSVGEKAPILTKARFKLFPKPIVSEMKIDTVRAAKGEFYRIRNDEYLLYQDIVFSTK